MFLYGNVMKPDLNDKFLFHYTTSESLLKILENRTLLLSKFSSLNDLNEREHGLPLKDSFFSVNVKEFIVNNCKLLSFSQNYLSDDGISCELGSNHPRMWAQYAENNKGACIVVNETSLSNQIRNHNEELFYRIENVSYTPRLKINESNANRNSEPYPLFNTETFLKENYKRIFFEKHTDWQQEGERRLFCINGPDSFSINNCLEFIVLGNRFEKHNYEKLAKIIISGFASKLFTPLIPQDFVYQCNASGRSILLDNGFRIMEYIRDSRVPNKKYMEFLNDKGCY